MEDKIFSPSFGNRPEKIIGRDAEKKILSDMLTSKPGIKDRTVIILGQRGFGKTVLLLDIQDKAREEKFAVISPTIVRNGMLERIIEKLEEEASDILHPNKKQITGGNIGVLGFSAGIQVAKQDDGVKSFGYRFLKICKAITEAGRGVLLLIDELQANHDELRELVISYQEAVGENLNIAIVMAGIPSAVSTVLNDRVLTFLNRARKIELKPIKVGDVDAYFRNAFTTMNVNISQEMRREAAAETKGSPYLMQLIGHYLVSYATEGEEVDFETFRDVLTISRQEYIDDICEATISRLSKKDLEYLICIAKAGGKISVADLQKEMNTRKQYVQKYKERLLGTGIITDRQRGVLEIDVPLLTDFLVRE